MEKLTGLINFRRINKVAAVSISGAEALTIPVIYLSSGNDLGVTIAVTTVLVLEGTLMAKGIEMSDNFVNSITSKTHKRIRFF